MLHGGTEKQLAALIRGFDPVRVRPFLCTLRPSKMDLREVGCPTIELEFRSFRQARSVACLRRLRAFIRQNEIDVVHTFFQDPTLIGLLGSVWTGVHARVVSFRDLGFWRTPAKVAQLRLAYLFFSGFVANSEAVAETVHRLDRIARADITIIYNGVERLDAPVVHDGQPRVVGLVANLDRAVKRVDLFIHMARHVADRVPDARFVVLGEGPLRPMLAQLVADLRLSDRVSFKGNVADMVAEVRQLSVGVSCSDSEGLSNAILEFMAAGVPTVARDVGGNRELIADGVHGRLVSDDRPDALAAPVVELLQNLELRRRLGAAARSRVEREFTMAAYVSAHEQYYERLMSRSRPAEGKATSHEEGQS